MNAPQRSLRVAILVFNGVEALDLAGPFEVFTTASRMQQRAAPEARGGCRTWGVDSENRPQRGQFLPNLQPHSPAMGQKDGEKWTAAVGLQPTLPKSNSLLTLFDVRCVARTPDPIHARAGMTVVPTCDFADAPSIDLLIVPGGVVDEPMRCAETLDWIARVHSTTMITASVCTGAFVLAASGTLRSGPVTTHWEDQADLAQQFPALDVQSGVRWVDQGRIVTSGGISAGIDMGLHLVARLANEALAQRTAHQMEFQWTRNA
ncbi:MAG: DJ-1/PfpI family protein [Hydrogenophaga sp.]